jgi:hypothetical protein
VNTKVVSVILAAAFLAEAAKCDIPYEHPCKLICQEELPRDVKRPSSILLPIIIVGAFACGCGYIWYKIRQKYPTAGCRATLVLNQSRDLVNWAPVLTNTVILTNSDWLTVFQLQTTDPNMYYKVCLQP